MDKPATQTSRPAEVRRMSPVDEVIAGLDAMLRTAVAARAQALRDNPAETVDDEALSDADRRHAAGLMRVNHAGEVMAQALYRGQGLTARLDSVRASMEEAAREEEDHLAWCEARLAELGSAPSVLNPFWYAGAFAMGAAAGAVGDRWSLGFVAETEDQVVRHLEQHLGALPEGDKRSRAIVATMRDDEARHADNARSAGGADLPKPVRGAMSLLSKLMTRSSYRV
jgi:ubiquinone biosynthesis monooxygenase Coq7